MKGSFILFSLYMLLCSVCNAQDEFTFDYLQAEMEEVESVIDVKPHFLGEEFAMKLQLLREMYTYKEVEEISLKENTVIEKPSIYNSVRKLNKYLKKEVKKGNIGEEQAKEQLDAALNVALNVRYQDTATFEKLLWDLKKDPVQIAVLFTQKVKLEM